MRAANSNWHEKNPRQSGIGGNHMYSIYIYIYMCVCVCVCVCIYMCVCVCVCVYIYIYIYMCIYMTVTKSGSLFAQSVCKLDHVRKGPVIPKETYVACFTLNHIWSSVRF